MVKPVLNKAGLFLGRLFRMANSNRRSNIEICADILRLLRLGPAGRIEIMHVAHITKEQASQYLAKLINAAIVEEAGTIMELPAFKITNKGLFLLTNIESVREMIPEEGSIVTLNNSKISHLNIGQVLVTRGVLEFVTKNKQSSSFVEESLERYRKGDWGEVNYEERQLNNLSKHQGQRLVSAYQKDDLPEIWITTTADRSYTMIMLPSEEASTLDFVPIEQAILT